MPTVSLSLTVKRSAEALAFYQQAFDARELYRLPMPDGGVAHAEFIIGDTRLYISDEAPEWHAVALPAGGTASCLFTIESDDVDQAYQRALAAGAESLMEPRNHFWGMRSAMVKDPFGYRWCFAQQIEELSPDEIQRRASELFSS